MDKGTKHYYLYDNDSNKIEIEQSDREKDIIVLVDETLSFNKHNTKSGEQSKQHYGTNQKNLYTFR
jgi:hypothetical protein